MSNQAEGKTDELTVRDFDFVRTKLLKREEIAFLDVREEAAHAEGHPLFAANFPYSRVELDAYTKMPRLDVPIVIIDGGEGLSEKTALRLQELSYSDVAIFGGGIDSWKAAGGETFIDVNVPSKAFGELVEATCHTPSLSAQEVKQMLDAEEDVVIVDVRRFDEYETMSIPNAISVPGAEVVLRVPDLIPNSDTKVVVNCAGRTRSLVGAQSLINAGLPNQIVALRNGTIGWVLAKQKLDTGKDRTYEATSSSAKQVAVSRARAVADQSGVKRASRDDLNSWRKQQGRTNYFFDVRSVAEFEAGHLPSFYPKPGGQLVQETEMHAPVRGARIVLIDDDRVRANMTASWLAQMAWDVVVVDDLNDSDFLLSGSWEPELPPLPKTRHVTSARLRQWLQNPEEVVVIDVSTHREFMSGHIPGSWYLSRAQLASSVKKLPVTPYYILTSTDGLLAEFAAAELEQVSNSEVSVLKGGNRAWMESGYEMETGDPNMASSPIDRYIRPYEGTQVDPEKMQAYLDWEFGLVEQLARDGTHHFLPISFTQEQR